MPQTFLTRVHAARVGPRTPTAPHLRVVVSLAAFALMLLAATAPLSAHAKPYANPKGWYTIEAPEGFQPKQADELGVMFETKHGDAWFRVQVLAGVNDLDVLTMTPLTFFQKILPNSAGQHEQQDLTIDGRPARWLVSRGTMVTGGTTQPMVAMGGSVAYANGGVVLMTGMTPEVYAKYGEIVAAAFRSLKAGPAAGTGGPATKPAAAAAGSPVRYEDPHGVYVIDLPPGFALKSEDATSAKFESSSGNGWFQLTPVTATNDLGKLSEMSRKIFDKFIQGAKVDGPKDLSVNGRPARWTTYRGTLTGGGMTTLIVGVGGVLSLPKCGLLLVTSLTPGVYDQCGGAIATSFGTVRAGSGVAAPGASRSPAPAPAAAAPAPAPGTVKKEAFGATSTVNADGTTTFSHPAGSFDLPPGWNVGTPTGDLTFAQFSGPEGASFFFMIGPRGYRSNKGMCEGVEGSMHKALPLFTIQPPGQYEVDSQRANKVTIARYKGPFTVEGREVEGYGFSAWGKGNRGLIVGIGVGTTTAALDDMEKIARTLR